MNALPSRSRSHTVDQACLELSKYVAISAGIRQATFVCDPWKTIIVLAANLVERRNKRGKQPLSNRCARQLRSSPIRVVGASPHKAASALNLHILLHTLYRLILSRHQPLARGAHNGQRGDRAQARRILHLRGRSGSNFKL